MMSINWIWLWFIILRYRWTDATDLSQCMSALGMQSGAIRDEDLSASSSFEIGNVGPQNARVRTEREGGAWCPKEPVTREPTEWLEVNLHVVRVITSVETQGRFGNGQGQEFSEAFLIDYWRPKLGKWVRYRNMTGHEILIGNINTYLEHKQELNPPIWASKIRFLPYSYHTRQVCMRVELYGCPWTDGILSYSMPQGDKRSAEWEFYDSTYDGYWNDELQRGLGQLTDGRVGPDNFRMGYYDTEKGQGWVGWRNDTRNGQPIEIKFEFDKIREFTAVHIYCNNQFQKDVQVFSEASIMFSVGGKIYSSEPLTYTYMEDRIFETSRNVSIKLHRRVGKFVKLKLTFAAKWIMISEITFDSDVAQGNFSEEFMASNESTTQKIGTTSNNQSSHQPELPISTAKDEDQTYMAIIIGVLMAVIILLAVAIFLIVSRHRQRKCFASPLVGKSSLTTGHGCPGMSSGSSCGTGGSYKEAGTGSSISHHGISHPANSINGHLHDMDRLIQLDTEPYQEPFHGHTPFYSYSTVVVGRNIDSDSAYEYAVPETGTIPLLTSSIPPPPPASAPPVAPVTTETFGRNRMYPTDDSRSSKKSIQKQESQTALKRRLEQTPVPEFPRHRLRMLSKLSEGNYGAIYVAEADSINEYHSNTTLGKRLVAVKFFSPSLTEKEKADLQRDVRILAGLEDQNIARVLGVCSMEQPLCVVMEYTEHGDLNQFLKMHVPVEASRNLPPGIKTLSIQCLLYLATQIASGMRYLESLNFVHRDLATRNCLVGKGFKVKISDFGTDNDMYSADYYKLDGKMGLPVRWMSWESAFMDKYSTKSDVWSFAVTLWEILHLAKCRPYEGLTEHQVVENLSHMHMDDGMFEYLPRPACSRDIYDLMRECWKRQESERPTFREIHLFLQRKNLGYAPATS
ncbi:discoidin domain-containing receptor tyrosine kinase B-like [Daktulosphaira vitifoliae]|uniref:discoidin domain-containing receptor tyrosine kinase B-like n=1 Tax=Daktulosphaira vitifoliae TaxID=58002 RepID=UPI0021AAB16D|nr:discoidin domain-containing receptor tyrosine kinase B-like [Daktulosphaira vitifoliae]XP_050524253.1 discoidin domain-containing receptor tyrosine kinase B-like [Daktulosphaira vitifoliae]XP_050524254.1 discoidin domain-containing receptor tyrosine kinase B-like [Daktulosphaira vitifoliae]